MIPLVAQSVFYLNSLMRLKYLMLASFWVVCHMLRAEEAEMSLLPHGHAKQQQEFDWSRYTQADVASDPRLLPLCSLLT